jgi:hypothetical protein
MSTLSCEEVDSSFTITWMDNFAKPTYPKLPLFGLESFTWLISHVDIWTLPHI